MTREDQVAFESIGIVGAGAWGTALAECAAQAGRTVKIWAYERDTVEEINHHRTNRVYLPGVTLSPKVKATARTAEIAGADLVLMVTPSQFFRVILKEFAPHLSGKTVIIGTKGFEEGSGKLMSDVLAETAPDVLPGVITGPSFAGEVARGLPTALTIAARDEKLGHDVANALGSRTLRLYWTDDMLGVQVGGAVKNVLAIASGIVSGRRMGSNAQAALISRGFAELTRFGMAMGARPETLMGLSGLGDLILTCSSPQSRNMSLGQALGEGKSLAEILGSRKSVSEGAHSAAAVVELARRKGIEMPICEAVRAVLSGEMGVDEAISALLSRPFRAEADPDPRQPAKPRTPRRNSR
jgi:glycerol-3-phosphate dehydrogenase (NAD(P)+)